MVRGFRTLGDGLDLLSDECRPLSCLLLRYCQPEYLVSELASLSPVLLVSDSRHRPAPMPRTYPEYYTLDAVHGSPEDNLNCAIDHIRYLEGLRDQQRRASANIRAQREAAAAASATALATTTARLAELQAAVTALTAAQPAHPDSAARTAYTTAQPRPAQPDLTALTAALHQLHTAHAALIASHSALVHQSTRP